MSPDKRGDPRVRNLEERIEYLEEVNRFTLDALDQVLGLTDFQPGINKLLSPAEIIRETRIRVGRLIDFAATQFMVVDEATSQFVSLEVRPDGYEDFFTQQENHLIESGTFAWALREARPVIVPAKQHPGQILLHSISTADRVRGMFMGLLGEEDFFDVSLRLLSIVLLNCANALQSIELYETINVINRQLSENVKRSNEAQAALKVAYERLQEAEAKYRSIFENAMEGIYRSTPQGRILDANPALAHMMGYSSPRELMNAISSLETEFYSDPERRREFLEIMEREGQVSQFESCCVRKDGRLVWLSETSRAIRGEGGEITHFEGMVQDITEQRKAEEKAEERRRQLLQADKLAAIGTLVAGVAHEINNPNGVIMLNVPIMAKAWQNARPILDAHETAKGDFILGGLSYSQMKNEIPYLFSEVQDAAVRIKRIVADLKDFARQDTTDQHGPVDINAVTRAAVRLVHHKIKKSTRNFREDYAPELPRVTGSFQKLEQILINLIINACQAMPDQESELAVTTSHEAETGTVVITVADQGRGMDQETIDHIMDPFFTTKRDAGGTGLGLSVSAGIVQEHGGELTFESSPGRGTTAILTLPSRES